jgi:hypothetical protein
MPAPRSRRPATPFVPRVEALEDRRLPAAACTVAVVGTALEVFATRGNNRIAIVDTGTTAAGNVTVTCRKQTTVPAVAITAVMVRTRGGNDTVTYNLIGPLVTRATRNVNVHFDTGQDSFISHLRMGLQATSSLVFALNGGQSSDHYVLGATSDIPIAAGALLSADLLGGAGGPDFIQTAYRGQLLGSMAITQTGGPANDVLSTLLTLNQGSRGTVAVRQAGGFGDDTFTLLLHRASPLDPANASGSIDGGPGHNTAVVTPGVTLARVQKRTFL